MDISTVAQTLGAYFGEEPINNLLRELAVEGSPKLLKGEDTTFLHKSENGLELTLTGERFLTAPLREYPEGAVVLTNIRFYGEGVDGFKAYTGKLPYDLKFGENLTDLTNALGHPGWVSPNGRRFRWDQNGHAVFATLGADARLQMLAIQLPVKK